MPKPKKDKAMAQPAVDQNIGEISVPNPHRIKLPDLKVVRTELRHDEDRITVTRNLRDDPLARLHDRGQITEPMFFAGRHWQLLYEASQVGRIGSSGDLKEPVDGTPPTREPITDKQVRAGKEIARVDRALGVVFARLIRDVLGDGMDMNRVSIRRGVPASEFSRKYYGRSFREALEVVVRELGYG